MCFISNQICVVYIHIASKVSVFGVILVRIFPHLEWIRKDTPYLSVFNPNAGNADQNNSEDGHFLRSDDWPDLLRFVSVSTEFNGVQVGLIKFR